MSTPPEKVPIRLDYSSPAEEHRLKQEIEDARANALANYDEATFGGRLPFSLMPFLGFILIFGVSTFFLPHWASRLVGSVGLPGFIFWEWYRRR